MQQCTIAQPIRVTGIGLHSGKPVTLQFLPAPINTGVFFIRQDIADSMPIFAHYQSVNNTQMSSNLVNEQGQNVGTVEHVMSAICALGIDNLQVNVDSTEMPIMDGSALPFIELLQAAGRLLQPAPKKFIQILRPVEVRHADKLARLTPCEGFTLTFDIEFDHPAFLAKHNHFEHQFGSQNFVDEIAGARTFGFLKDIEYLKSQNLGLGGSMDNALVLDDTKVLNPQGLRFEDEFVRHKILDAIGDLYLAGHQILGNFYGYKSGHMLNNNLLKAVFSDETAYRIVTNYDRIKPNICYFN